jgi:hypothetical protein
MDYLNITNALDISYDICVIMKVSYGLYLIDSKICKFYKKNKLPLIIGYKRNNKEIFDDFHELNYISLLRDDIINFYIRKNDITSDIYITKVIISVIPSFK